MKHRINYNIIKHLLTKFRKATKFIFFNGSAMMALNTPPPPPPPFFPQEKVI